MLINPEIIRDAVALADFLPPRNKHYILTESWERGGVALGDPSEPLTRYEWYGWTDGTSITLKRADIASETVVVTGSNITEMDFTFDQNMRPCVAYIETGIPKLYWYDTVAQKMSTKVFDPNQVKYPRVSLDDKRRSAVGISDIILGYINQDNDLCYRQQRTRFDDEHVLKEFDAYPAKVLWRIGMTKENRFGFYVR